MPGVKRRISALLILIVLILVICLISVSLTPVGKPPGSTTIMKMRVWLSEIHTDILIHKLDENALDREDLHASLTRTGKSWSSLDDEWGNPIVFADSPDRWVGLGDPHMRGAAFAVAASIRRMGEKCRVILMEEGGFWHDLDVDCEQLSTLIPWAKNSLVWKDGKLIERDVLAPDTSPTPAR